MIFSSNDGKLIAVAERNKIVGIIGWVVFFIKLFVEPCYAQESSEKASSILKDREVQIESRSLAIAVVNQENLGSLLNLAQAYEAEFSSLTGKMPGDDGIFKLDTMPFKPYVGYIFYYDGIPIGFCILNPESNPKDISEYYIVPVMRRKNLGYLFAQAIFSTYPGQWQVRQIQGADQAVKFWRRLISQYTQNQYVEERVNDPEWGLVTRQLFVSKDAGGVKPLAVSHK